MTTELDINKYITAVVNSDSVIITDSQNGEVVLGGEVFERIYQQYLEEQENASFVREVE